eukprot:scaffold27877_cov63-Phaeocystis_antarctica.AAC.2
MHGGGSGGSMDPKATEVADASAGRVQRCGTTSGEARRRDIGRREGRRTTRGAPPIPVVWARGGARNPLQTASPPLSPGRRGGATAQSALGWYRPSVLVSQRLQFRRRSGAPVLRPAVYCLDHLGKERRDRVVDELLEEAGRLLVGEVETELLGHLEHVGLALDVLYVCVGHEHEQVEDEVGGGAQDIEGLAAEEAEAHVELRVRAAHSLNHLLAELHRRRERLGVPAEDVPEVTVADAEQVHGHAVACAAFHKGLETFGLDAVGRVRPRVRLLQVAADVAAVLRQHLREWQAVGHALDEPLARRSGEAAVGRELEVEALLLEEVVHQQQHLDDELVLP